MNTKIAIAATLLAFGMPLTAYAYIEPEEVLLNQELFLPPSARETQERTMIQSQESAARRNREQERAFALQNPVVVEAESVPEESLVASAPEMPAGTFYAYPIPIQLQGLQGLQYPQGAVTLDATSMELARTMRLLARVNQNQTTRQVEQILHSSADDLAPTGAGSVLAMMTMLGAVAYTLWRVRRSDTAVSVL